MLFFSKLLKNTRLSTTSVYSLICHMIVIFIFYFIYRYALSEDDIHISSETESDKYNTSNIFYFTVVSHSTLGLGDMHPKSKRCKTILSIHIFIVIMLVAFFGSN